MRFIASHAVKRNGGIGATVSHRGRRRRVIDDGVVDNDAINDDAIGSVAGNSPFPALGNARIRKTPGCFAPVSLTKIDVATYLKKSVGETPGAASPHPNRESGSLHPVNM